MVVAFDVVMMGVALVMVVAMVEVVEEATSRCMAVQLPWLTETAAAKTNGWALACLVPHSLAAVRPLQRRIKMTGRKMTARRRGRPGGAASAIKTPYRLSR